MPNKSKTWRVFAPYLGDARHTDTPTTNCDKLSERLLPMTGRNDGLSAPRTLLNRKRVIAARKKTTPSKNVLLVNALLMILFLSDTYVGRVHDKRIADATPYP